MTRPTGSRSVFDQRVYAQDAEPTDKRNGVLWTDTSTSNNTLKQYNESQAAFVQVVTPPPALGIDEAETFAESDVSLSLTDAEVAAESLQLASLTGAFTPGTSGLYDSRGGSSTEKGCEFVPNKGLDGVRVEIEADSAAESGQLDLRDASQNVLTSVSSVEGGDTVDLVHPLDSGVTYYIIHNQSDTEGVVESKSFPLSTAELDVTAGYDGGVDNSNLHNINAVAGLYPASTGEATVSWPAPDTIDSWDSVFLNLSPDGQTVTVDVLDAVGGSVVLADVGDGADLSGLSTADDLALRLSFDRSGDVTANPTAGYVARRWVK